jgi:hypothetical protein
MIDVNPDYLGAGLDALARDHTRDYFVDGHRGAGIVAAQLLCAENRMDRSARERIEQLIDLNWASTSLCSPFPESDPEPERISEIGAALVEGGETLRQVGHNTIDAMLAIKAFRLMPSAATRERIDGVCALVRAFTAWRDIEPDPDVDPPAFADTVAASRYVLREACEAVDRFVGFGQGYAGHMLTFGQALIELADMGDEHWAESCRPAFRKYVTVARLGPGPDARPMPDHQPSGLRPTQAAYWLRRSDHAVDIGHVFKYPYSCCNLLRRAGDPRLAREWEKRAHHLF